MEIIVKKFDELSAKEVYEIGKIRSEIFVVEQNCIYLDLDGNDYESYHVYMLDENKEIVSYCRVLKPGLTYQTAAIGRVITNKKYRGNNYARKLLEKAIQVVKEELKENEITIGAQSHLQNFYASLGFKPISDIYDEDGILHIDMNLKL